MRIVVVFICVHLISICGNNAFAILLGLNSSWRLGDLAVQTGQFVTKNPPASIRSIGAHCSPPRFISWYIPPVIMIVTKTISDCRSQRKQLGRLALVPTMGALHAGHISLIELAKQHADRVAVSIFVNPTQFGPREDFYKYPRPIEDDLAKCEAAGVEMVFNPPVDEIYPTQSIGLGFRVQDKSGGVPPESPPAEIHIDMPTLSGVLEGRFRANHFKGVCQIVAKLFNIVQPDVACFGQKDFQQLRILTAMVEALNWPIEMIAGPTLRDPDGLAMSSRNRYLSAAERQRALSISKGLFAAEEDFKKGVRQANRLVTSIQNLLLDGGAHGRVPMLIDYVAAVDALSLKSVEFIETPTVLAVAARVGPTRLIDNVVLTP
jgi:pantoate--beta-alanine ligase